MRTFLAAAPRAVAGAVTASLVAAGLALAGPIAPALADSAPSAGTPATVTADALPTVQIDGVAWSQVVVGGTVYVAGQFTTARPAGAAAGASTVARSNLLAYDLATGNLISTWAPVLDGPAYVITASLDGTRLYVGGDFTRVNGSPQNRIVVLDRAAGTRVAGFTVGANAAVRAIVSTPSTIYFGGNFNTVAGNDRPRLAAMSSTTGALLTWRVSAQSAQVDALTLSPDNTRLIVGGRFATLGGIPARGSGAVSTSTAAVLPWAANAVIQNWGFGAGITSLSTDGTLIYGAGFAFIKDASSAGNLEGIFAANPTTGAIVWVEDCHGDTYSVFPNPGKDSIYAAGHPHDCSTLAAYPEVTPRVNHYALAFAKQDSRTLTPTTAGGYFNWSGYRSPAQLDFYPDFVKGTFTGQNQATWNVTGTSDYVLYGGEFLSVNGTAQQGLVRMAVPALAPNAQGPRLTGTATTPAATSEAAGTAQVSWPTNWDRDNETLTYRVLRDSSTTPVFETTARSTFYERPRLSFTDTGLVSGRAYSYRIVASDPAGNSVTSPTKSVTVAAASAAALGTYAREVLLDGPSAYWRLGETSGVAQDWTGFADSTVGAGVTRSVAGGLSGETNRAAQFTGSSTSRVLGTTSAKGTNRVSVEAWFKTTSTAGGKIVGFGDSATSANSTKADRHVYMRADGTLSFGVNPNQRRVITTPSRYNDGQWHQVTATLGTDGMKLYVDGALRAADAASISAQLTSGYWRIGGDLLSGWPGAAGTNFVGAIDDVAVYGRALTADEVSLHHGFGATGAIPNLAPVASFMATPGVLTSLFDGSASTDADGAISSYAWDFGDGATATGATPTHPYLAAGTYTVALTVTDNAGRTGSTTRQVVVRASNQPPVASFTATVTNQSVAVDASASTDADGSIASYAWDFGDGTTGTGATASHAYAAPGTFPVNLTVTDNGGAAVATSRDVTATASTTVAVASDAFARTVTGGFGTADLGGPWTTTAGAASVSSGSGRLALSGASASAGARLPGATGTQLVTRVTESWDKRPAGSGGWFLVRGRITPGGEYRLKVGHKSGGSVTGRLVRTNAAAVETAITAEVTVPGLTYTAGSVVSVLFEVTGTGPTTLRAKVWAGGQAAPVAWLFETMDATAGLQVAGHTGLAVVASSTTTNGPVTVTVDDFTVTTATP